MEITEVRIKLMEDPSDRLCAFCSITLDECFVIRDLKIIQGSKGAFVAMPSRKLTDRCPKCHSKNHLRASFCNQCGIRLHTERASKDDDGRAKLYADIAHPINSDCRDQIQQMVIKAYEEELVKARQEGYVCSYDDFEEDRFAALSEYSEEYPHEPSTPHVAPISSPEQNSQNSSRTLETPEGKTFRIDSPSSQESRRTHDPERNSKQTASPNPNRSGEGFGEGII